MTSIARHMAAAALASFALAGCANCSLDALRGLTETKREETKVSAVEHKAERKVEHAAPKAAEPPAVETAVDDASDKRKWCGQRFIDYQDGKRPGGARTIEQKQADDRACEMLKQNEKIETGSIPKQ
jgi:hypothetical protein